MRAGIGYDVHRFAKGRDLILGGVKIPWEEGLIGHSDADVLTHAIMDALLGAACLGDIGELFPDTDEKFKDADSIKLLSYVGDIIQEKGYDIENIDSVVVCQRPKIAPYRAEISQNIADALNLRSGMVSVKATTEEGLGFTGEGLGIAAKAIAVLRDVRE